MFGSLLRPLTAAEVQFRLRTLRTGVWPSIFTCLYTAIYFAATWERPNRLAGLVVIAVALLATIVVARLPADRLIGGRWAEVFFISWSLGLIALIYLVAAADGGASSPLAIVFVLPLVYSALSYPLVSMLIVAAGTLVAYITLAATVGGISAGSASYFTAVLVNTAWICSWQARNHDRQRHELARVSRSDALTGVLNRRGFEERFAVEIARAQREDGELVLMVLDLDDLKVINDTHGHAAGDRVLREVADQLTGCVRRSDAIARLGGDEFGVLLAGGQAAEAAERVARTIEQHVAASYGSATFPCDGTDQPTLHRAADIALYVSKAQRSSTRVVRRTIAA